MSGLSDIMFGVHRTGQNLRASHRPAPVPEARALFKAQVEEFAGQLFARRLTEDLPRFDPAPTVGSIPEMFCSSVRLQVKCGQSGGFLPQPTDFHALTLHPDLRVTAERHEWDQVNEEFLSALGAVPCPCLGAVLVMAYGQIPSGWDYANPRQRVQVDQWRMYRAMFTWARRWAAGVDLFTMEDRRILLGLGVTASEWDERYRSMGKAPERMASRLSDDKLCNLLGSKDARIPLL